VPPEYTLPIVLYAGTNNEAVLEIKPTALIGVSTVGGAFNRQVIENMSLVNERPIIFPAMGLAGVARPGDIRAFIKNKMYIPDYK
jgi:malic enzyme